ncbi:MAG: Methyltransferase type 12 [Berkelbacteria bacterium GW2011_GWA1_36_9]|uniref:Methyltransferase type 12 n=1 Tax=Berkelbacteria bacterium GW2011_GWA1_36_9 TaxID=1618331 RepID=A0A0G0FKC7_9BACT|nr:MAG: Methyltransferase type 12 [Berkelbacteria bacterium GW2011_GWA1_36_9]
MSKIEELSLELISKANNYNKWVYENMKPYLKSPVLEVGSGIGTITSYIAKNNKVIATDVSKKYVSFLKKRFVKRKNFLGAKQLDLTKVYKIGKFKTVVCTNVLHHVKDDEAAIGNIHKYLEKEGLVFVQEPAHMLLFGSLDKAQNHFRRYSKETLAKKFRKKDFKIKKVFYGNSMGALGWFLNSRILNKKEINPDSITFIDKIFPFTSSIEKIIPLPLGLSVFLIAEKR